MYDAEILLSRSRDLLKCGNGLVVVIIENFQGPVDEIDVIRVQSVEVVGGTPGTRTRGEGGWSAVTRLHAVGVASHTHII